MIRVPAIAFEDGILDPVKHARLVVQLDHFADRAGIDPKWLWTSAVKELNQNLISYLRKCQVLAREKNQYGIVFIGKDDMTSVMSSMAGALIRCFVDGRLMSAQTIADLVLEGEQPDATVLFCPNFSRRRSSAGSTPAKYPRSGTC